jgi:HPt (histidine-containing phosphotransfer) domain-containing protein
MEDIPFDRMRLRLVAETAEEERQLLELFLQTARDKLALMEQAIDNDDLGQWKTASHSMKGMAGNLGMGPIVALCTHASRFQEMNSEGMLIYNGIQAELERVVCYLTSSGAS